MRVITTISELRTAISEYRQKGEKIGLVPTMGYLHQGHMSLVEKAKTRSSMIVMTIFVNPLQFGPNEDFSRYPRDFERDVKLAEEAGVSLLFAPEVKEMYPQKSKTVVSVSELTDTLCGTSRPGHFDGVSTVVMKLFNIVQPDFAFFGEKDAQQVAVIQQMVTDLNVPIEIVPCPIVREKDGLAMSSRNVYLNEEERKQAVILSQTLKEAEISFRKGLSPEEIRLQAIDMITKKPLARIDYVHVLSYPELRPLAAFNGSPFIVALAVKFGNTRLIDNKIFDGKGRDPYVSNHDEIQDTPSYSH